MKLRLFEMMTWEIFQSLMILVMIFSNLSGLRVQTIRRKILLRPLPARLSLTLSQSMSYRDIKPYVTHLPTSQVMVCRFCESCIPPKDPFEHYKRHHTAKKDHYVSMEARHKIANYMKTFDLCQPQEVKTSDGRMPELKIIKEGFRCKFPGCDACTISEPSMRMHYYIHQKYIIKDFKNWESTAIQTFFEGYHKEYEISFIC